MLTVLNRWRGMKSDDLPIKLPQTVRKLLCGLTFGLCAGAIAIPELIPAAVALVIVWLATFGAFTDGHGNQMDLDKSPEDGEDPNLWDKIFGREGFWPEFLGMTASGFIVAVPFAGALVYFGYIVAGILFLVVPGMLKGASYLLAQEINFKLPSLNVHGNDELGRNPDGGEVIWGFVLDIGLLMALISVFLVG